jgi:hypothetical protein
VHTKKEADHDEDKESKDPDYDEMSGKGEEKQEHDTGEITMTNQVF